MISKLVKKNIQEIIPYEPGKPIEELKRELGLNEVIKIASNENALGPSPLAIKALKNSLNSIYLYPDGGGYFLREKLAKKFDIAKEEILLGNGSDEILRMIVETFLNIGEEVITGEPSFAMYKIDCKVAGAECITVPLKNFTFYLDGILKKITPKTKLIFIANPNNPTGTIVTEREIGEFLRKIPSNIIVVFDEAYYEYIERKDFPDTLRRVKEGENIIILRTFSKIYGLAGLRIGYCFAKKEIISALNKVRPPFNTNSLAQKAALSALDDEEHVKRSKEMVREGKKYFYHEFEKIGLEYVPSETNFVLVNVRRDSREVFHGLLKKGIIIRAMDVYGLKKWIRVTVGKMEENKRFLTSLVSLLDS